MHAKNYVKASHTPPHSYSPSTSVPAAPDQSVRAFLLTSAHSKVSAYFTNSLGHWALCFTDVEPFNPPTGPLADSPIIAVVH